MIRDVIALMRQVPEDSFDVEVWVKLPADLHAVEGRARDARAAAELAQRGANEATAEAVRMLRDAGLGPRDMDARSGCRINAWPTDGPPLHLREDLWPRRVFDD